ncbi:MAG: hypothetical protein M1831_000311 [Alyxoria varia]|nr:MAG: hypothetical protein M1831_000311 [Alyxoria varia]
MRLAFVLLAASSSAFPHGAYCAPPRHAQVNLKKDNPQGYGPPEGSNERPLPTKVAISEGDVVGTTTELPSATATVNKYLGIPFADSPPKRFASPQKPKKFDGALNATAWKDSCIQQNLRPVGEPLEPASEDCLYLNVYAPSSPSPPEGRAVMFWIYGGGLRTGSASASQYDGSAFAAYEDVIIVAANYRLNVFGFPAAPEIPKGEANVGFLDQRMALEWTQRNVKSFGGDPKKVTVFGESAGAMSVDGLLTSYPANEAPFRAAILQSGQNSYKPVPPRPNAASWKNLTSLLGCDEESNTLECARAADASKLKDLIEKNMFSFQPASDGGATLADSPAISIQKGEWANVPTLIGSNKDEGQLFNQRTESLDAFFIQDFADALTPKQLDRVNATYRPKRLKEYGITTTDRDVFDMSSAIQTEQWFQCTAGLWSNLTSTSGSSDVKPPSPMWRYQYAATFPNLAIFPGAQAFHGSELQMVFQSYLGGPINTDVHVQLQGGAGVLGVAPTNAQKKLSGAIARAWANFAKDPTKGPGWSAYEQKNGGIVGVIGVDGEVDGFVTETPQDKVDSWERCELFKPFYRNVTMGGAANPGLEE